MLRVVGRNPAMGDQLPSSFSSSPRISQRVIGRRRSEFGALDQGHRLDSPEIPRLRRTRDFDFPTSRPSETAPTVPTASLKNDCSATRRSCSSALAKNNPFVLSKNDPHEEQDWAQCKRTRYGFRTFRILELALYHSLGKLPEPEPELTHDCF